MNSLRVPFCHSISWTSLNSKLNIQSWSCLLQSLQHLWNASLMFTERGSKDQKGQEALKVVQGHYPLTTEPQRGVPRDGQTGLSKAFCKLLLPYGLTLPSPDSPPPSEGLLGAEAENLPSTYQHPVRGDSGLLVFWTPLDSYLERTRDISCRCQALNYTSVL